MIIAAGGFGAFLFSILSPAIFISAIYIGMPRFAKRNDPAEIKRRATILGIITAMWPLLVLMLWGDFESHPELGIAAWFGLKIDIDCLLGVLGGGLAAVILYLGPLA
jgi:hypothetical protein